MPSRAPQLVLGVEDEAAVDRVADPALEAAQRGLWLLPRGDLALVVAPAGAWVAQLGDRGHVDCERPLRVFRTPWHRCTTIVA